MHNLEIITGIGSVPHKHIADAIAYSLKHHIPFFPQPTRIGSMIELIETPTSDQKRCMDEFKSAVMGYETVKTQCAGPVTLYQTGHYNEPNEAVDKVYQYVYNMMNELYAKKIILFLDEPGLGDYGGDYEALWSKIFQDFPVISGVHTCGNMDLGKLLKSQVINIISYDANSNFNITRYPEYKEHRHNKRIAWGIKGAGDVKEFRPGDLFTWVCGMPHKSYMVEQSEEILKMLVRVSQEVSCN